jgi:endonuclease/exonuclease/phosphatase (EEP) superfamily protein YafD
MLDLLAAFRPQLAALLAALGLLLWLVGSRTAAVLVGLAGLVNLAVVAPLLLPVQHPDASGSQLRILSHNVHGGGDERFAQVTAELKQTTADLVLLYEMSPRWIDLFGESGLTFSVVHPLEEADHRRIMVLSKRPVVAAEPVELIKGSRSGGIAVDVMFDGRPVRILAVHTHAPRDARSASLRDAELAAVQLWVSRQEMPVIVVGDLNVTPWSHAFRQLQSETALLNSQRGFGIQPTWPAGGGPVRVPIDHMLHDPELSTVGRSTGPSLGSAHLSLNVALTWRPAREPGG